MAFVDDDQVEKVRRKHLVELLSFLRPGDRLVEAKVDLVRGIDATLGANGRGEVHRRAVVPLDRLRLRRQLGHRRAEGAKIVDHRLIDQDVTVGQKQNPLLALGLPQPPDDLKSGVGLASARGHDQQHPVTTVGDGLDRSVDGVELIVAWGLAAAVVEIVLQHYLFGVV